MEKAGWAIDQLPAEMTALLPLRKPGRQKGQKPGKLPAKWLQPFEAGSVTFQENRMKVFVLVFS